MKIAAAGLLIVTSLVSCEKSETSPSLQEILTSRTWQLTSYSIAAPPESAPSDITTATFKACELDDLISFEKSGLFSVSENTKVCPSGTNLGVFYNMNGAAWYLSGPDTLLTIKLGFLEQSYRISRKSVYSLEIYQVYKNYFDELQRYNYVLKAVP